MKSLVIVGTRWTDSAGNTYHCARIIIDGVQVANCCDYGYGEAYMQSAATWLRDRGLIELSKDQPLWTLRDKKLGGHMSYFCFDVGRKKDL